ncbi:MAG TPA: tetratricopeptide repeat protein [Thermoanaerobaculia bacterium]|jgi:tetratricopeptide (TPR) repeat protein|nr:tetratricopeptide repeat protein [Thermoanaerobaculia bacterium]
MRNKNLVFLLLTLLLLAGLPVFAQSWAGRGRLQGEIKDEQGKPVEGAQIWFRMGENPIDPSNPGDGPKPVTTSKYGKWSVLGLAQGTWRVLIVKDGYLASEGQVKVLEGGAPPPPIVTTLKVVPKEAQQAAKGNEALEALERGNQLLGQEKYAEARAEYEKAIAQLEPVNHPPILRGIARTYYQEKNTPKAVETLKQALAIKPDDVESLRLIVNLLVASGQEKEAQEYMAKLPQGETVDPATLLNIGIKYYNEGKMPEALGEFDRVVKENPNLPDAYYYRGLVYLATGKNAEAKADFQKLLQLDPNHPNAKDAQDFLKSM